MSSVVDSAAQTSALIKANMNLKNRKKEKNSCFEMLDVLS
jgi:hypothetical protein